MNSNRWLICFLLLFAVSCTGNTTETVIEQSKAILATRPTSPVWPTPLPTLARMDVQPVNSRPEYIAKVSPEEYSIVPQSIYNGYSPDSHFTGLTADSPDFYGYYSSICIRLFLSPLAEPGDIFLEDGSVYERVEFLVDSGRVPVNRNVVQWGLPVFDPTTNQFGWIDGNDYCWIAHVAVGIHEVLFRFHQTSGTIQDYSWYFEISE